MRCYDCRPSDAGEPPVLKPWVRADILFALAHTGPEASELYPWTDEELERHWREWAKEWGGHHPGLKGELPWDESTYAFWRFERGLDVGPAIEAMLAVKEDREQELRREQQRR